MKICILHSQNRQHFHKKKVLRSHILSERTRKINVFDMDFKNTFFSLNLTYVWGDYVSEVGIKLSSRRIVILTQTGLVQVREVEIMKVERRKHEGRGGMVEKSTERENFSKSDVTSVTSTRLDPFCPAVSERSTAEFERNGWSRA